jgi:phosphoribosylformylglycinamidine synthase
MWQIAESIKGLGEAARAFEIPVISGNVSLYNETNGVGIQPTPLLALVGLIEDVSRSVPSHFQDNGDAILLIGTTNESELGGGAYLSELHAIERGALPELNYTLERSTCQAITTLISKGVLKSCHDLSQGGLGVALAECCFRDYDEPCGARIRVTQQVTRPDAFLFAETGARFIVSCAPEKLSEVRERCLELGLTITAEGAVGGSTITVDGIAELDAHTAFKVWFGGLSTLFEA